MAKNSMGKRELDLKDYLYYAFKEFSRYPNNQIWATYLTHWDEVYAQLVEIVEQHFHNLEPHPIEREGPISQYKTKPDPDTQEGVDEDIIKWIDEHIRYNELTVVEDHICADEAQKEIDMLKRIKQLLARQPVQVDEEEEEEEQPSMDKETAGDKKYHELKDEDRLDKFGRKK